MVELHEIFSGPRNFFVFFNEGLNFRQKDLILVHIFLVHILVHIL